MKKRMIAGLMAVLMTMSLAACGSSAGSSDASGTGSAATGDNSAAQAASGDKVTLSLCWWGNQTRNDVTKKAVDLYMEHIHLLLYQKKNGISREIAVFF